MKILRQLLTARAASLIFFEAVILLAAVALAAYIRVTEETWVRMWPDVGVGSKTMRLSGPLRPTHWARLKWAFLKKFYMWLILLQKIGFLSRRRK